MNPATALPRPPAPGEAVTPVASAGTPERAPLVSVVIAVTENGVPVRQLVEAYGTPLRDAAYDHEFVFVLDGVSPAVEREVQELRASLPVDWVRLQGSGLGESIALSAGVGRAAGRFILNAPQYLQAEPADVVKVVQALEQGADFVTTWRHPRVDPWFNRLQSRFFNWVLRFVMGIRFHDLNSSLRGMRREVLEEVNVYGELYRFLPVLAQRQGFHVVEVKVRHREERGRKGFFGVGVYTRRLLDILAISFLTRFTQKPLRFFGMLGFASMLVGLALCAMPVWEKLTGEAGFQNRPVVVLGAILVAFGIQLIGFGLVGEIIIFTQAANLRGYKIQESGAAPGDADAAPAGAPARGATPAAPEPAAASAAMPVRVRELVPGEDARFDAFVRQHPLGTFFHLSGWRKVVEDVFHHEPHYLVAEQGRQWRGVLPLFLVRSPFLGRNLVSVPYGVYGGVLADAEPVQQELLAAAEALGRAQRAGYVELRHLEARPGERRRSQLYVTFRKVLPATAEAILLEIPKKARAEVRRARDRFGLTCRPEDDLATLHRLFSANKRRLGSPSLPLAWFEALREEFGRQVVVHVVRTPQGEAIAAVMSFCLGDTVYAYYSGSREDQHKTGVNDFLYHEIMRWALEQGYRRFDFGRSRRDTGAAAFKRNMGFAEEPLHYEYLLLKAGATPPEFHPSNPRLGLPRKVWAHLPLFLTARLGSRLSRYLP